MQENSDPRETCVRNRPQGDNDKNLFPLLGIKLGLKKNFLKVMNKYCMGFEYLKEKFPEFSNAKLKKGLLYWTAST